MKAIQLYLPQALYASAQEKSADLPLQIITYRRLTQKMWERLHQKPILLVAPAAAVWRFFRNMQADSEAPEAADNVLGRVLLVEDKETPTAQVDQLLEHWPFIEALPSNASVARWRVRIARALADLQQDELLREKQQDLDLLNQIGMALSTEQDLECLLASIVSLSRQVTHADAGSLYLVEAVEDVEEDAEDYLKNKKMRFVVAQNDSYEVPFQSFLVDISEQTIYGHVAIHQKPLRFDDVYHLDSAAGVSWGGRNFDERIGYRTKSMLTVPMVNYRGQTIGVIQLINSKDDPESRLKKEQDEVHIRFFCRR